MMDGTYRLVLKIIYVNDKYKCCRVAMYSNFTIINTYKFYIKHKTERYD